MYFVMFREGLIGHTIAFWVESSTRNGDFGGKNALNGGMLEMGPAMKVVLEVYKNRAMILCSSAR